MPRVRGQLSILVMAAAVLTAMNFGRLHEAVPVLSGLPIGRVLIPVCGLALLLQPDFVARLRAWLTPQGKAFWLFLAAIVLSVPFSLWPHGSLTEGRTFMFGAAPFVLIVAAAGKTHSDINWIIRAVVVAVIGFGLVVATGGGTTEGDRVYASSTYDPNDVALMAVVGFPLAVCMIQERNFIWRSTGMLGAGMALLLVVLSASRGGAIAMGVTIMVVLFADKRTLPPQWRAVIVAGVIIGLLMSPALFRERLATLAGISEDYNISSPTGRIEIWKRGFNYIVDRPLVGVGFMQFATAEGRWIDQNLAPGEGFHWGTAHNMYIQTFAELGIPGFIGFMGLFVPTILLTRRTVRMPNAPPHVTLTGNAISAAIVGFLVGGLFLSMAYSPPALTLAGLGMAYWRLVSSEIPAAAGSQHETPQPASTRATRVRNNGHRTSATAARTRGFLQNNQHSRRQLRGY